MGERFMKAELIPERPAGTSLNNFRMMSGSLKIKVCGMREPDNLEQLCALEPDFVGYIFYQSDLPGMWENNPMTALFSNSGRQITRVGVFVNEPILVGKKNCGIGLGGCGTASWLRESPDYCKRW